MNLIRTLIIGAFAALSLTAADMPGIAEEARKVQNEAQQVGQMLRAKSPDYSEVSTRLEAVERHNDALREMILQFEAKHPGLSQDKHAELERMKQTAAVKDIFIENKKGILAQDDRDKNRRLLRAKADGIAKRAEILQASALRMAQ